MGLWKFIGLCVSIACVAVQAVDARTIDEVTANGEVLARSFRQSTLTVHTTTQKRLRFQVFLAQNTSQRSRGLMYVESLPDDVGMLFLHAQEHLIVMWMKNTPLPLDMLFIDREGRIISIAKGTTPYSLGIINSLKPAIAVLEINGGLSDRLGIQVGDRVEYEVLK